MTQTTATADIYTEARDAPSGEASAFRSAALLSMPVSVAVCVGRARATIEELLSIGPKSVLALDAKIDDPVELIVGERVIARGRLVELGEGGAFGVEIVALADDDVRTHSA